jgi:hypothetical protein
MIDQIMVEEESNQIPVAPKKRNWYTKKRFAISGGVFAVLLALIIVAAATGAAPQNTSNKTASVPAISQQIIPKQPAESMTNSPEIKQANPVDAHSTVSTPTPAPSPVTNNDNNSLSNDSTYQNSNNDEVHSPAYDENDQVPAGATAESRDSTYSFSEHRSGTCSRHGGVEEWLQ